MNGSGEAGARAPPAWTEGWAWDPEPGWTPSQCWVFLCGGAALGTERVKKRKQPRIAHLKKPHRNQVGEIERCRKVGGPRLGPGWWQATARRQPGPRPRQASWESARGLGSLTAWVVPRPQDEAGCPESLWGWWAGRSCGNEHMAFLSCLRMRGASTRRRLRGTRSWISKR